jgi:hypothetical protein
LAEFGVPFEHKFASADPRIWSFPVPNLNQIIALEPNGGDRANGAKSREQDCSWRAHLELQINLMTERETTNVIRMLAKVGSRVGIQHNALDEEKLIKLLRSKFPSQ